MSLTLTRHTTCYYDDRGSTPTGSFSLLCINASNMLKMTRQYKLSSLRSNHSKGVENYFTDALLYQETGEAPKKPLPDDDDSGNEADSESEADMPAIFIGEPIIACLNTPQCNTPSEDEGEWVINDNISFDYPASIRSVKSITDSSLHMPLHKPSAVSYTHLTLPTIYSV